MNAGVSAESPSACRSFFTAVLSPCSKSTNVSDFHSRSRRASRATISPGRSTSAAKYLRRLILQVNADPLAVEGGGRAIEHKLCELQAP